MSLSKGAWPYGAKQIDTTYREAAIYGYLLSNTIAAFDEAVIKCRFRIKTVLLNTQFHCIR